MRYNNFRKLPLCNRFYTLNGFPTFVGVSKYLEKIEVLTDYTMVLSVVYFHFKSKAKNKNGSTNTIRYNS